MNFLSSAATGALIFGAITTTFSHVNAHQQEHQEEIACLALNIYHEARGESIAGQIAVAEVTINRMNHTYFPDTVCGVVWEPNQFSWTHDGISDQAYETEAYTIALNIAETVYYGQEDEFTGGALFYHADYITAPNWTEYMEVSSVIGKHIFYTWNGSWN